MKSLDEKTKFFVELASDLYHQGMLDFESICERIAVEDLTIEQSRATQYMLDKAQAIFESGQEPKRRCKERLNKSKRMCPICKIHEMEKCENIRTPIPPKYEYKCKVCGHIEYVNANEEEC